MSNQLPAIGEVHCLVIAGAEARRFAQAQYTSDVDALRAGQWQWSAWLNPAGRVIALMQLFAVGDARLVAVLRGGNPEALRAGLARYLLHAQATLVLETRTARAGGPRPLATAQSEDDCVVLGCGSRSLWLDPTPARVDAAARSAWRLADIRAGWANVPAGEARHLAPALGLVRLGAIATRKGCYPGQEIMARLQHRGDRTRGLYHVRGQRALLPGEHTNRDRARSVWVLDVEATADGCEALVTAPPLDAQTVDIDGDAYEIVAAFTG